MVADCSFLLWLGALDALRPCTSFKKDANLSLDLVHLVLKQKNYSAGSTLKKLTHKNATLVLGRNEFRDVMLKLESGKKSQTFIAKEVSAARHSTKYVLIEPLAASPLQVESVFAGRSSQEVCAGREGVAATREAAAAAVQLPPGQTDPLPQDPHHQGAYSVCITYQALQLCWVWWSGCAPALSVLLGSKRAL